MQRLQSTAIHSKVQHHHQESTWPRRKMVFLRALKDILSIKIKARHDSYCDQFNRLFMTKMLLISSVIMGFDYFSDRVSCMVPKTSDLSKDFIHSACWISGFYVYEEMSTDKYDESGYYGIPRRVDFDGIFKYMGGLCRTKDQQKTYTQCVPMTRAYYLHYQWMPFYIGALAVFFYLPYILFRMVNTDLISLKTAILSLSSVDSGSIVKNYFNYRVNTRAQLRLRIWWNIWVKVLYVFVSSSAFLLTDHLLLGRFKTYGRSYLDWMEKSMPHTAIYNRKFPKAGNVLLPSMGLCDISEASLDTKRTYHNENRFICEISPHVLYQYVLMVLWFFFVASISISILGFVKHVGSHVYNFMYSTNLCYSNDNLYRFLTLREIEYLAFIKKKSMIMYGNVVHRLKSQRYEKTYDKVIPPDYETSNGFITSKI